MTKGFNENLNLSTTIHVSFPLSLLEGEKRDLCREKIFKSMHKYQIEWIFFKFHFHTRTLPSRWRVIFFRWFFLHANLNNIHAWFYYFDFLCVKTHLIQFSLSIPWTEGISSKNAWVAVTIFTQNKLSISVNTKCLNAFDVWSTEWK
jgi:hypothetical protein